MNVIPFQTIFKGYHQHARCCLHCGSWFSRESLFCQSCENLLWERHAETAPAFIDDSKVDALFRWRPDEDRQLSKLLKTLKGGYLEQSFKHYAQEFLTQKKPKIPLNEVVLIPCPGKRPDHAWQFARQFSELLDIPIWDILQKSDTDQNHQKQKSKIRTNAIFSQPKTIHSKHVCIGKVGPSIALQQS